MLLPLEISRQQFGRVISRLQQDFPLFLRCRLTELLFKRNARPQDRTPVHGVVVVGKHMRVYRYNDINQRNKDHSSSNILKALAQTLDAENLLTVMEVVQCLWQASTTGTTIRDGPSNFELCSELGATRLEMG